MPLSDYQQRIDESLQPYAKPYWHPLSQLARLSEELGEISRILNHQYGDKPKKADEELEDLAEELADLIYGLLCVANREGINLDEAMEKAITKIKTRDKDRFQKKKPE